jgi:hypothetical protein
LVPEANEFESRFSWVRQPVGKPCPSNLLAIIERLRAIQALGIPVAAVDSLSVARRQIRPGDRCRPGVRCELAYTVSVSLLECKRLPRESSIS